MLEVRCFVCRHAFAAEPSASWVKCPACRGPVYVPTARSVAAGERIESAIDAEGDLEDDCRSQLYRVLQVHRQKVIERARSQLPPEPERAPSAAEPAPVPVPVAAPVAPRAASGPSLWSRLGPVFAENVLFALAAFLLVAGAVYFTTTAWTTMSGMAQKLVVAAALLGFAGLTHGASVALARAEGLLPAARVLSMVAAALVPAASGVAGLLFAAAPLLAITAGAGASIVGHLLLRTALRREDGPVHPRAPWLYDVLVLAAVFAPSLVDWRILASCAVAAVPLAVAWLQRGAERQREGTAVAFPSLALWLATSLAALAFGASLALAANVTLVSGTAPLGVIVAAAALAWVVLESAGSRPAAARLIGALCATVVGAAMATGDVRCLMVAAWCGALVAGQGSLRLDQARLLVPAVALSAIGYLFLPAPVREMAMQLRAAAAGSLGYAPERLPLSFYGISFLPYLGLLALVVWWLRRTSRPRHRRVTSVSAMSVAGGLAGMALLLGSDLRAPMAVLPADGLLLVALGYLGHSASAVFAGCLGVLGGLACAMAWLHVAAGPGTVIATAATLVLLELARRPAGEGFPEQLRRSYRSAALVAGVAMGLWLLGHAWPPFDATPWSMLHAVALAPVLVLLRRFPIASAKAPTLGLLPALALWGTATGVAAVLAAAGAGRHEALPFAFALATAAVAAVLPHCVDLALHRQAAVAFTTSVFALQLGLLPSFVTCWREPYAWSVISGLAAMTLAAGALAYRARIPELLAVAVLQGAIPLHMLAGAWLGTASGPAGFVGPAALALAASLLAGRQRPVAYAAAVMALLLAIALPGWRLMVLPGLPATGDAWAALITGVLIVAQPACLFLRARAGEGTFREVALTAAGLALVLLPVSLLDLLVTELPHYAIGFLAVGAVAFAVARNGAEGAVPLAGYGLWQTALGLMVAFAWSPQNAADHRLRLGLFLGAVAVTAACRPRQLRTPSTVVAMAALIGAAVVQPVQLGWIAVEYWVVATLCLCAVMLAAVALPRWRSRARAVKALAAPAVLIMALVLGGVAATTFVQEPLRNAADGRLWDAIAVSFLAAALALSLHWRKWGAHLRWTAAVLAACVLAPLNALLHGHRDVWFRPDLEVALLALAIAVTARRNVSFWALTIGLLAACATNLELRDVSTPVTVTVLAGVPLVLLLRRQPGALAWGHGLTLVAAAWSWVAFALAGGGAAAIGPWLALSAAAVAAALGPWLRTLRLAPADQLFAARACAWVLALGAVAAGCFGARPPMTALEVLATLVACAVVAAGSGRAALAPSRAPLVHLALAAVIVAYAALGTGTELLAPLAGRHHHALTVLGATLFVAAGRRATALRQQWFAAGVAMPLLAVPVAMVAGGLTFALLAGAAVLGFGAVLGRARWLGALALVLGNAGLFHLWLDEGVFDPSFYGVPAGLSLVFGAELARRALGPARVMALRVTGLSVLYGSVLVQVARVQAPAHALLLFALAMAAVAWGIARRQAPVLVAGVAAVVLDVIAYLAQRGFEQDFLGSVLLVGAGGTVFAVAARTARRRARTASAVP